MKISIPAHVKIGVEIVTVERNGFDKIQSCIITDTSNNNIACEYHGWYNKNENHTSSTYSHAVL